MISAPWPPYGCDATYEVYVFRTTDDLVTTKRTVTLRCHREGGHTGHHLTTLPEDAGADAGKLLPFPTKETR